MTITVLPMDATAGAPAYSAKSARQAQAALYGNPTGRVFGTRSGWRVGTLPSIVSVTSTTWTVNPSACMIEPAASLYQGCYGRASDAVETGAMTAADATNPRIDILYIQVNDSSAGDGSGGLSAPVSYLAGVAAPAGTQVAPALPPRSFLVATIAVPKSGGGSPTVTFNKTYFTAAGGVLPIMSTADLATLTPYAGLAITRLDLPGAPIYVYDGTIFQLQGAAMSTLSNGGDSGWTVSGVVSRTKVGSLTQCVLSARAIRNLSSFSLGASTVYVHTSIPSGFTPALPVDVLTNLCSSGGAITNHINAFIATNGDISFSLDAGSATWPVGGYATLNAAWWQ